MLENTPTALADTYEWSWACDELVSPFDTMAAQRWGVTVNPTALDRSASVMMSACMAPAVLTTVLPCTNAGAESKESSQARPVATSSIPLLITSAKASCALCTTAFVLMR